MNSPRRMRRQARRIRRGGMQPMMLLTGNDQLSEPALVLVFRWVAWVRTGEPSASTPPPDDLANRCELRVLDMDPHADAIPWPGPSVTSITQPIDFGPFEDATPCRVLFLRRHGLAGGATGGGKSGWLNVLVGNLVACTDVVIWGVDLKKGMELGPWSPCIDRLATTADEARALLADAVAILEARAFPCWPCAPRKWPAFAGIQWT